MKAEQCLSNVVPEDANHGKMYVGVGICLFWIPCDIISRLMVKTRLGLHANAGEVMDICISCTHQCRLQALLHIITYECIYLILSLYHFILYIRMMCANDVVKLS